MIILILIILSSINSLRAQYTPSGRCTYPLNGRWYFCLDPFSNGEREKRFESRFPVNRWDTVTVPHCFSADKRFEFYTGVCWYKRSFELTPKAGKRLILHFDAVYYRCKIWLNDRLVGTHEGGYTPFKFDVTNALLTGHNTLSIQVDNSWSDRTLPGSKPSKNPGDAPIEQMFAWINYGGIIRPVYLTEEPEVYISNLKIEAYPNLTQGTAELKFNSVVENTSNQTISILPRTYLSSKTLVVSPDNSRQKPFSIIAHTRSKIEWTIHLKANQVRLWGPENPEIYTAKVAILEDTLQTNFGIREIAVKGTQLLLNGEPIKRGGANRVIDFPDMGSLEPDSVIEKDIKLMKAAGMTFQRIYHHPASESLLRMADRYGLLIIEKNGNTALVTSQLKDTIIRNNYKKQFTEMVERDWNHPSVVAWSVGNEFESDTPEGIAWVKDMKTYAKSIDSRLVTFASNRVWKKTIVNPADEASMYSDFVSTNIYDDHLPRISHIHELYPDKPILITEYGYRTDRVLNEVDRIGQFKKVIKIVRSFDYVIGASIWTFNDYRSRYVGTNPNGYRPWGVVDPFRNTRPLYDVLQHEYCPVKIIQENGIIINAEMKNVTVSIEGRSDFPAYTINHYKIKWGQTTVDVPKVSPGQKLQLNISALKSTNSNIELLNEAGLCVLKQALY